MSPESQRLMSHSPTRRQIEQRQQHAFEEMRERGVELERRRSDRQSKGDMKTQGNIEFYSLPSLLKRQRLREHPQVQAAIRDFWEAVDLIKDDQGRIRKHEYLQMNMKLHRALVDEINEDELHEEANRDWERDMQAGNRAGRQTTDTSMDFATFGDSMFELADTWCEIIDGEQYYTFLQMLLQAICHPDTSPPRWLPDDQIHYQRWAARGSFDESSIKRSATTHGRFCADKWAREKFSQEDVANIVGSWKLSAEAEAAWKALPAETKAKLLALGLSAEEVSKLLAMGLSPEDLEKVAGFCAADAAKRELFFRMDVEEQTQLLGALRAAAENGEEMTPEKEAALWQKLRERVEERVAVEETVVLRQQGWMEEQVGVDGMGGALASEVESLRSWKLSAEAEAAWKALPAETKAKLLALGLSAEEVSKLLAMGLSPEDLEKVAGFCGADAAKRELFFRMDVEEQALLLGALTVSENGEEMTPEKEAALWSFLQQRVEERAAGAGQASMLASEVESLRSWKLSAEAEAAWKALPAETKAKLLALGLSAEEVSKLLAMGLSPEDLEKVAGFCGADVAKRELFFRMDVEEQTQLLGALRAAAESSGNRLGRQQRRSSLLLSIREHWCSYWKESEGAAFSTNKWMSEPYLQEKSAFARGAGRGASGNASRSGGSCATSSKTLNAVSPPANLRRDSSRAPSLASTTSTRAAVGAEAMSRSVTHTRVTLKEHHSRHAQNAQRTSSTPLLPAHNPSVSQSSTNHNSDFDLRSHLTKRARELRSNRSSNRSASIPDASLRGFPNARASTRTCTSIAEQTGLQQTAIPDEPYMRKLAANSAWAENTAAVSKDEEMNRWERRRNTTTGTLETPPTRSRALTMGVDVQQRGSRGDDLRRNLVTAAATARATATGDAHSAGGGRRNSRVSSVGSRHLSSSRDGSTVRTKGSIALPVAVTDTVGRGDAFEGLGSPLNSSSPLNTGRRGSREEDARGSSIRRCSSSSSGGGGSSSSSTNSGSSSTIRSLPAAHRGSSRTAAGAAGARRSSRTSSCPLYSTQKSGQYTHLHDGQRRASESNTPRHRRERAAASAKARAQQQLPLPQPQARTQQKRSYVRSRLERVRELAQQANRSARSSSSSRSTAS
jgi:hypothetical protein